MVLSLIQMAAKDWEIVTRVAYVIFGGLLPLPVYLLAREMYGRRIGLLAAFLTAICPAFMSGVLFAETMSEPLFLFCLFTGAYHAYRASTAHRAFSYAMAGVMLALAYLTRPEGLLFFCGYLAYLVLVAAATRPLAIRQSAVNLGIFAGTFLLCAAPYVVYLHGHTGHWDFTTKATQTYVTTRALVDHDGPAFQREAWGLTRNGEVAWLDQTSHGSLLELLLGPYRQRVWSDIEKNLQSVWNTLRRPWVFGSILLAFGLLGIFGSPWSRRRLWDELFNALMIVPLASFLIFFIMERYLYPALLPFMLWAALGIDVIFRWAEESEFWGILGRPSARMAIKAFAISALALYLTRKTVIRFDSQTETMTEVWEAAHWIESNTPAGARIMSSGPEVAFHAGRSWCPVPVASREEVVAYGRRKKAEYLCLRGRYLERRPEQSADLFDNARTTDDLELLVRVGNAEIGSFVVYKLR
jgi:hypothetical protein